MSGDCCFFEDISAEADARNSSVGFFFFFCICHRTKKHLSEYFDKNVQKLKLTKTQTVFFLLLRDFSAENWARSFSSCVAEGTQLDVHFQGSGEMFATHMHG